MADFGKREWLRVAGNALMGLLLFAVIALPLEVYWSGIWDKQDAWQARFLFFMMRLTGQASAPTKGPFVAACFMAGSNLGLAAGSLPAFLLFHRLMLRRSPRDAGSGWGRSLLLSGGTAFCVFLSGFTLVGLPLVYAQEYGRQYVFVIPALAIGIVSAWFLTWALVAVLRQRS